MDDHWWVFRLHVIFRCIQIIIKYIDMQKPRGRGRERIFNSIARLQWLQWQPVTPPTVWMLGSLVPSMSLGPSPTWNSLHRLVGLTNVTSGQALTTTSIRLSQVISGSELWTECSFRPVHLCSIFCPKDLCSDQNMASGLLFQVCGASVSVIVIPLQ